jgi:hypothetical protein
MSFGGNLMGPNTAYNHGYPGTVAVEETSSSGPVCENGASGGQSASGFVLQGSVAPGQTASTDGFIILYGYYSPANPSGDRSLVNGPYFQLLASLDTTGGQAAFSNTRGIVAGPTGVTPLLAMPLNPEVTTCGVSTNPNLTQNGEPFVCPSSWRLDKSKLGSRDRWETVVDLLRFEPQSGDELAQGTKVANPDPWLPLYHREGVTSAQPTNLPSGKDAGKISHVGKYDYPIKGQPGSTGYPSGKGEDW